MPAPTFTLRPYQQKIFDEIPRRLVQGSVLVYSPARSGKSKIIAATVTRILKAGRTPLVVTHRGKIQKQLIEHCGAHSIDADTGVTHWLNPAVCHVAMNQTLVKRTALISQLQALGHNLVVIVDEAHRGDFNKLLDHLKTNEPTGAMLIGFTATPAWRWSKFLPKYYKSIICGPQVRELIVSGNITPIEYHEMRNDLDELETGNTGEFTEASQNNVFNTTAIYDGLFNEIQRFSFNKCIVFCASKKSADALHIKFIEQNYAAVKYYSGMKDGTYQLGQFTTLNAASILITVSALSEGFDHPPIDLNIIWRATTSLPLFIQMGMRGATPYDSKLITTVLDFGGNNTRFGGNTDRMALTMDRDWGVLWQPPEKPPRQADGVAAIKNCPACEYIISALAKSCCNCGYIYPESEQKLIDGELIRIEAEQTEHAANVTKIIGRKISTLSANELALYALEKNKKSFAARIAKWHEQTQEGWLADYAACMNYNKGWITFQKKMITDAPIEFTDITIRA